MAYTLLVCDGLQYIGECLYRLGLLAVIYYCLSSSMEAAPVTLYRFIVYIGIPFSYLFSLVQGVKKIVARRILRNIQFVSYGQPTPLVYYMLKRMQEPGPIPLSIILSPLLIMVIVCVRVWMDGTGVLRNVGDRVVWLGSTIEEVGHLMRNETSLDRVIPINVVVDMTQYSWMVLFVFLIDVIGIFT